jgi:hypothetical protein
MPTSGRAKNGHFNDKKYLIFGNPAIPVGPVALRPRVAPGLPFSESYLLAKNVPKDNTSSSCKY